MLSMILTSSFVSVALTGMVLIWSVNVTSFKMLSGNHPYLVGIEWHLESGKWM